MSREIRELASGPGGLRYGAPNADRQPIRDYTLQN